MYNIHRCNADHSRKIWLCEVKRCRARVQTMAENQTEIIDSIGEHFHSSDVIRNQRKRPQDMVPALFFFSCL